MSDRKINASVWLPRLFKKPLSSPGWKTGAPAALAALALCAFGAHRSGPLSPHIEALHLSLASHCPGAAAQRAAWLAVKCIAIPFFALFASSVSLWLCERTDSRLQSPAGAGELLFGWSAYPARWLKNIYTSSAANSMPGACAALAGTAVFFITLAAPEPAMEAPGAPMLWLLCYGSVFLLAAFFFGRALPGQYQQTGAARSLRQQSAFETARLLSAAAALAYAGGAQQADAVAAQSGLWFSAVPRWFVFFPVAGQLAFAAYAAAAIALCQTGPFRAPRGSDICGGWSAGARPAQFAIAEFARGTVIFLSAYCGAVLFLGGAGNIAMLPGWFLLALKTLFLAALFGFAGAVLAPCGLERTERFGWKKILPMALASFVITGVLLCLK